MALRRLIQFPHPGCERERADATRWSTWDQRHARKFMEFPGRWIDAEGAEQEGLLCAWGEWEPESTRVAEFRPDGREGFPLNLWRPHYRIPADGYVRLHNTDPFIFGERFLYSNCNQRGGLKELARGSLILFGSKRGDWLLDTVLVIGDSTEYEASNAVATLRDSVPETFLDVTAKPIAENSKGEAFRLYCGATPEDRVGEHMFSFFPARPADAVASGFRRPPIKLPPAYSDYFNEGNGSYPRGHKRSTRDLSPDELDDLWHSIVEQVRDAGLVLGTHAELPEQRDE